MFDQDLFGQIGNHQVILGNQDLQHAQSSGRKYKDRAPFGRTGARGDPIGGRFGS
jgi:hypothetical protein